MLRVDRGEMCFVSLRTTRRKKDHVDVGYDVHVYDCV
jgi:hypothetical protein